MGERDGQAQARGLAPRVCEAQASPTAAQSEENAILGDAGCGAAGAVGQCADSGRPELWPAVRLLAL